MKAAVIHRLGEPEVLEYADVVQPNPTAGQVLIKVLACGINHYDIFLRQGQVNQQLAWPHVMGADVVGEIVQVTEAAA